MTTVKKMAVTGAALGLLLLASPMLRADDGKAAGDAQGKHWDKFERLKKELDLSDDQVSQWKDAEKGQRDAAKLLKDKAKADEAQLAVLVDEKASDEKLSSALEALQADKKAVAEQDEKQKAAIQAILTPLQQAKWALSMGWHRGGRGGFGGGWKPMAHGDGGPEKP